MASQEIFDTIAPVIHTSGSCKVADSMGVSYSHRSCVGLCTSDVIKLNKCMKR